MRTWETGRREIQDSATVCHCEQIGFGEGRDIGTELGDEEICPGIRSMLY